MQNPTILSEPVVVAEAEGAESISETTSAVPNPTSQPYAFAAKAYRNEQILNLSPVQVIDKLYTVAIQSCKKNDAQLARRAINELIVGLNFEYEEISTGLYRLYEYCKDCVRKGKMDDAVVVLEDLRSTWAKAFNL
jgi:flagellin-specific chaperone FliS